MKTLQLMGGNGWGGAAVLSVELCRALSARGWEVHYLSDDPTANARFGAVPGARILDDIPLPRDVRPATDLRAFARIVRLCRRERYAVVETYNSAPGVVGRLAARAAGCRAILHHQAAWATPSARGAGRIVYWLAERAAVGASTFTVCCGEAVRESGLVLKMPSRKLITIRNGIDLSRTAGSAYRSRVAEWRSALVMKPDDPLFGYAGRLSAEKDNATLLDGFARYRADGGIGQLAIAGDGPEGPALRGQAARLGLESACTFLGHIDDVLGFLGAIDVFVTTTLREGLSMSILESMGASRPAIVSDLPNNRELVRHGETGILVPIRDPSAVAAAMARLGGDEGLRTAFGKRARQRAEQEFSLARFVDRHVRLYEALASPNAPRRPAELIRLGIAGG